MNALGKMNVFLSPLSNKRQKESGNQITKRDHSSKNIADDTFTLAAPPPPKACLRNAVFRRAAPVNCNRPPPKKERKKKHKIRKKKYERRKLSLFGMSLKVL